MEPTGPGHVLEGFFADSHYRHFENRFTLKIDSLHSFPSIEMSEMTGTKILFCVILSCSGLPIRDINMGNATGT